MKLGLFVGYGSKHVSVDMDLIKKAESLGYDSVWAAEAYGGDVISVASWILAQTEKIRVGTSIMQMPARTPACSAMTAMALTHLSNGRFIVGLGASGPQVVEGWHGVPTVSQLPVPVNISRLCAKLWPAKDRSLLKVTSINCR